MDNKEFSKLLEKRTRDFAVRIIKLSAALPNTPEGREIRKADYRIRKFRRGELSRGEQSQKQSRLQEQDKNLSDRSQ